MITLMTTLVLDLQIAMVGHRWVVTNIRIFAAQSFLLAGIANTIAFFNHAPHIYAAAFLTFALKGVLLPMLLERLVEKISIKQEIEPLINVPLSLLISGRDFSDVRNAADCRIRRVLRFTGGRVGAGDPGLSDSGNLRFPGCKQALEAARLTPPMILLPILAVPLAAGALSFAARKRP